MISDADKNTWPSPRGPYSGNANFDVDIAPPLKRVWERKVTGKYNDGMRVGSQGRVLVPTRGKDIECLALKDGQLLWAKSNCREVEDQCYVAGANVWSELGYDPNKGSRVSAIDIETSAGYVLKAPSFMPQGIYAEGARLIYRQRDGIIHLDDIGRAEKRPTFLGRIHNGLAYGALDDGSGALLRYGNNVFSLSCHNPATSEIIWTIALNSNNEQVVSVADRVLITYAFENEIRIRSTADGRLLWSCQTEHALDQLMPPVVSGDLVYRWEGRVLRAHALLSGDLAWEYAAFSGRERTNIIATRRFIWTGAAGTDWKHSLLALDKTGGQIVWTQKLKSKLGRFGLALIDDSFVAIEGSKLVCYRSQAATPVS